LSVELGDANFYLSNLKAISELYQTIGNAEKALDYLRKYSEAGDSIKNATQPIKQEELQHELNSEQLIEQAVTLKNNQPDHTPQAWLIVVTLAVTFTLIALSAKYFGSSNLHTAAPASLPSYSETGIETLRDDEKTVKLVLSNEVQQLLWTGLQDAMENQKCYLQPDLTLHDLAMKLDTNTLYLSKIINDRTGQNFSSYINQYRISEASRLLLSDSQLILSIEGIAHSCGFNSKSAFNAAFRKLQNMTPTEFIEKHKTGS
jgi:YesN/AraC family two-component response regulator